jgi:serine phosphatase RsbU (regulator of sigma subunit)
MPLGLMPGMSYEEKEALLVPGDTILFYTDGFVEAHNSKREMFGSPRLLSLMNEYTSNLTNLTEHVLNALARFTGEAPEQEDDITLVTLERSLSGFQRGA